MVEEGAGKILKALVFCMELLAAFSLLALHST